MILHTVNKALPHQALQLCLRFARAGDCILLLEDGVCNSVEDSVAWSRLKVAACQRVLALDQDLQVRGLAGRQAPRVELIDYPGLVALCCRCDKVQSWF